MNLIRFGFILLHFLFPLSSVHLFMWNCIIRERDDYDYDYDYGYGYMAMAMMIEMDVTIEKEQELRAELTTFRCSSFILYPRSSIHSVPFCSVLLRLARYVLFPVLSCFLWSCLVFSCLVLCCQFISVQIRSDHGKVINRPYRRSFLPSLLPSSLFQILFFLNPSCVPFDSINTYKSPSPSPSPNTLLDVRNILLSAKTPQYVSKAVCEYILSSRTGTETAWQKQKRKTVWSAQLIAD